MALNIGDINFGVEAETAGLQKAVNRIQNFRRVVNETASAQQAGSSKAAAAMARQESAMKRALQQAISMRAEMKRLGAAPQDIANVTHSIQRLTKEMSSGKLSTVEFTRSMDSFNTRMKRMGRTVKDLKVKQATKRTGRFNEAIRDLESASVLAVGPLSGLGARVRALGAITSRSTLAIAGLLGAITGLTVGLIAAVKGSVNATREFNKMRARVVATTGSLVLAEVQLEQIGEIANNLGLDIKAAAGGFSSLAAASRGTALEGNATIEIFEGLSSAAAAMRLNSEQLEGAIRAVEQMMSKGNVQAEELRGQLGERIPGAFRLASEAMGVSTKELNKMLEQGEVVAEDFLPKLAKQLNETFGDEALKNADTLSGSINQLTNATFEFFRELDKAIAASDAFKNIVQSLTTAVKGLTANLDILLGSIGAVGGALLVAFAPAILGGILTFFKFLAGATLVKGIVSLAAAIRTAGTATGILAVAMNAIPGVALLTVITRIVAVAAAAVFGFKMLASSVDETASETDRLIDKIEAYNKVAEKQGSIHKENAKDAIESAQKQIKAMNIQTKAMQQQIQMLTKEAQESETSESFKRLFDMVFDTNWAATSEAEELTKRLNKTAEQGKQLAAELEKLKTFEVRDPTADIGADEMSKELEKFLEKLRESKAELEGLQRIMDAQPTTIVEMEGLQELEAARMELFEFSKAEKEVIRNEIGQMFQQQFNTAAEALAFLRSETSKTEDALESYEDALRKTPEIMREYTAEMASMTNELAALNTGPLAMEAFERQEKINKAIEKQREALEQTNLPAEERNRLLDEYETKLKQVMNAEENFSDASDRMASAIAGVFEDAILEGQDLMDVVSNLEKAIVAMITRIAVMEPLEQGLRGMFEGGGMNGGGFWDLIGGFFGGGGGAAGAGASAGGAAGALSGFASGGSFKVGGSGGIDSQLVAFKASPGEQVEVKPPRKQGGSDGVTIVNNFNISAPNGNIPRKTQQQIANETAHATQRAMRRNG